MRVSLVWHPYRYFPYERALARREVEVLFAERIRRSKDALILETNNGWRALASRLTYFREALGADGSRVIPQQARLEESANGKPVRRQSTRYSAHGLHEYKGKFNPQIVRVIGNILGVEKDDWVLDPFCGSGTVLLEAAHIGWNAVGVDINPLSVEVARAKVAAMRLPPEVLLHSLEQLRSRLRSCSHLDFEKAFSRPQIVKMGAARWHEYLPCPDYLLEWFPESVLAQLFLILTALDTLPDSVRLIFRVVLSDIVREVSFQDPGDLRIRRLKSAPVNRPAIPIYLETLKRRMELILGAQKHLGRAQTTQTAFALDARQLCQGSYEQGLRDRKFDAIITSPPYATALPYIDTQRLSLVLLGLIDASKIRATEKGLIGNREITTTARRQFETALISSHNGLPRKCLSACRTLLEAVGKDDGFRRINLPSLVYKYFVDMGSVFDRLHKVLKSGAPAAIVVGPNSTNLNGKQFVIDTPEHLVDVAREKGFVLQESISLDTYQRFDLHQANSIRTEVLLILRAA
jgi:methylase of polypeptide subunit release factors